MGERGGAMIDTARVGAQWPIPGQRRDQRHDAGGVDRRPRFLRWIMPYSCATSVPLDGNEAARMKFIAYH